MNVAARLVRLYPAPLRERWGADLESDIRAAGWRSWHNALLGVADMWLHPFSWPAATANQRRGRVSAMAIAVALCGWLVARRIGEPGIDVGAHPASLIVTGCAILLGAGLLLVAPRPRAEWTAVALAGRRTTSRLGALTALAAGMIALARSGAIEHPSPAVHLILMTCWWAVLALGAAQTCRTIAELGPVALHPPAERRLRLGSQVISAALAIAGTTLIAAVIDQPDNAACLVEGSLFLALALILAHTLRDVPRATESA